MKLYGNAYKFILKKDFMLLIIVFVLIFFTSFIWFGVPVFIISGWMFKLEFPVYIQLIVVSLSVGILLSLYFVPFNIKVAKKVAEIKQQSTKSRFIRIQSSFVLLFTMIFVVFIIFVFLI